MKYLITGGCGFVGANLAAEVIKRGEELIVLDNLSRLGSRDNLKWLQEQGSFHFLEADVRFEKDISTLIKDEKPDYIFHLAGQVAMTTSIENPRLDFEINVQGTLNVLIAVKEYSPNTVVLYSSTNKVYGDFSALTFEEGETRYTCKEYPKGFPESITLNFHSPYGCSKGSADQYLLDFHRIFGLKTVVFRHSSMYGSLQRGTFDQGWIAWFCQKALEIKQGELQEDFTISGTGKQVRDVLHSQDVVNLYFTVKDKPSAYGQAFNIGGGYEYSLSLLELFALLEEMLDIEMKYKKMPWRESDQKVFIADNSKITKITSWQPQVSCQKGIEETLGWMKNLKNLKK